MTGQRLASLGLDVRFVAPRPDERTADVLVLGRSWEIKAPTGAGRSTIEQAIRRAQRQSDRVILDLFRTTLTTDAVLDQIQRYWRVRNGQPAVASVWVLPENVRDHFTQERWHG